MDAATWWQAPRSDAETSGSSRNGRASDSATRFTATDCPPTETCLSKANQIQMSPIRTVVKRTSLSSLMRTITRLRTSCWMVAGRSRLIGGDRFANAIVSNGIGLQWHGVGIVLDYRGYSLRIKSQWFLTVLPLCNCCFIENVFSNSTVDIFENTRPSTDVVPKHSKSPVSVALLMRSILGPTSKTKFHDFTKTWQ